MSGLKERFDKLKKYKVELRPPFPKTHFLLEVTNKWAFMRPASR